MEGEADVRAGENRRGYHRRNNEGIWNVKMYSCDVVMVQDIFLRFDNLFVF